MNKLLIYGFIVSLSIAIGACNLVSLEDYYDLVKIEINETKFSLSASEPILASFENISGEKLYIAKPASSYLQVLQDGAWETIGPWYIYPHIAPYLAGFQDGELFYSGLKSDEFVLEVGKTFRIAVALFHLNDFEDPLSLSQRTTKPFSIVP